MGDEAFQHGEAKERGNHYFRYTDQKWGKAQNYHLSIDSSLMGISKTADLLVQVANLERS